MFRSLRCFFALSIYIALASPTLVLAVNGQDDDVLMEPLPIHGMVLAQKDGQTAIFSTDLRFQVRGSLIDRWNDMEVTDLRSAAYSRDHIDLKQIGINHSDIASFSFGTGPRDILLIVDPTCPHCHKLLKELGEIPSEYTLHIMSVGLLSENARKLSTQLNCATNKQEAYSSLLSGAMTRTLQQKNDCTTENDALRYSFTKLLGVSGVPFVIRDDGYVSRGSPQVPFNDWLEAR